MLCTEQTGLIVEIERVIKTPKAINTASDKDTRAHVLAVRSFLTATEAVQAQTAKSQPPAARKEQTLTSQSAVQT